MASGHFSYFFYYASLAGGGPSSIRQLFFFFIYKFFLIFPIFPIKEGMVVFFFIIYISNGVFVGYYSLLSFSFFFFSPLFVSVFPWAVSSPFFFAFVRLGRDFVLLVSTLGVLFGCCALFFSWVQGTRVRIYDSWQT